MLNFLWIFVHGFNDWSHFHEVWAGAHDIDDFHSVIPPVGLDSDYSML